VQCGDGFRRQRPPSAQLVARHLGVGQPRRAAVAVRHSPPGGVHPSRDDGRVLTGAQVRRELVAAWRLEWLAQRIEHPEPELGALVEEQHAAVAQRSVMYLDSADAHETVGLGSGASGEWATVDARAHHLRFCVLRWRPGSPAGAARRPPIPPLAQIRPIAVYGRTCLC
jgi:hypothetical protein